MSTKRINSAPIKPAEPARSASEKENRVSRWAQAWSDQFRREMASKPAQGSEAPLPVPRRRVKPLPL